jgi:two-component system, cell cycle sensor histidine kinase and response regulator CckA
MIGSDERMDQVVQNIQGKRILFVDDEDYLAQVGREMLEDYGYEVDIMTRSPAAFALFQKAPFHYDALITDYTMPEMTGDLLMEKIHRIRPGLPVIICTGITPPPEIMDKIKNATLLMKPFDMEELLQAVYNFWGK